MTKFTVINHDTEQTFIEDTRSDAQERKQRGVDDFEFAEEDLDVVQGAWEDYSEIGNAGAKTDGGDPGTPAAEQSTPESLSEKMESPAEPEVVDNTTDDLPDRDVSDDPLAELGESLETDPLSILPGHMVDNIQGQPAVNKRGYAMIAERYGIETSAEIVELPWENDEGRCVAKATAITEDDKEYSGWATASADDGDMPEQLIELAETRSLKRSVSWASGVGIVSYQELSQQLE